MFMIKSIPFIILLLFASIQYSCKSSSGNKKFCDSTCLDDTLKFTGDHELKPYLYVIPYNCSADSLVWSYSGLGANRKTAFDYSGLTVNKNYMRAIFRDTSYVYLLFNDCNTGRGYQLKLPFNKTQNISKRSSGINNLDPKFAVADNMVAYTDRGNIYVEEPATNKKAMMTFGKATDMDYDVIHETLDTVNVTSSRIWVKVKIDGKWIEKEKKIILE
jgi:hypothetical protein